MKDFLKFNSDKSYVHEVTHLTDAKYDLKRHQGKNPNDLLKSIRNSKWYDNQGHDVTSKVKKIYNQEKNKPIKLVHSIRMALSK